MCGITANLINHSLHYKGANVPMFTISHSLDQEKYFYLYTWVNPGTGNSGLQEMPPPSPSFSSSPLTLLPWSQQATAASVGDVLEPLKQATEGFATQSDLRIPRGLVWSMVHMESQGFLRTNCPERVNQTVPQKHSYDGW
ncbi:hypothetical protein Y1Q_0013686 [Alligator mississippiensis]|uniref:Uncharacterized protein n=1 Tax=Alligator mississippiensis TaxID=8496 RepID=A0A151P3P9_ALLMI|nr:hypothetical protein Y1Q_0013686 [Alligator mississippiensis]